MRTTGNGRRNRGAGGPATSIVAGSRIAPTGPIPVEAKAGAGVASGVAAGSGGVASGVGVTVGVGTGDGSGVGVTVGVGTGDGSGVGDGVGAGAATGAVGADLTTMVKVSIVAVAATMSREPTSAASGT